MEVVDIAVVGEDGRVTIPKSIRKVLKISKGDRVIWSLEEEKACMKKV